LTYAPDDLSLSSFRTLRRDQPGVSGDLVLRLGSRFGILRAFADMQPWLGDGDRQVEVPAGVVAPLQPPAASAVPI